MYAMETVPIPEGWGERIDAAYYKEIRQLLEIEITYGHMKEGKARTNTNEDIMKTLSEYLSTPKAKEIFKPISQRLREREYLLY